MRFQICLNSVTVFAAERRFLVRLALSALLKDGITGRNLVYNNAVTDVMKNALPQNETDLPAQHADSCHR